MEFEPTTFGGRKTNIKLKCIKINLTKIYLIVIYC